MSMHRPELLAPAGDIEKAKVAIDFGADAIFLGGKAYSLRARASNFGREELEEVVAYAHQRNAKVYVATNIICHNQDTHDAAEYLKMLKEVGVDAVIAADPFIIDLAVKIGIETHISTQQSITNSKAAKFWNSVGANRVVTAREVTGDELKAMIKATPEIEYEYFIHGAVCIAYSGRCTMSNHFSYRDSNRGGCAQSCRWMYDVEGDYEKFTMSAKDSALYKEVADLTEMGVHSFKIEGRMKSLHYVGTVVSAYRQAIDNVLENNELDESVLRHEIEKAANRDVDTNFFYGTPDSKTQFYGDINAAQPKQDFIFTVLSGTNDKGLTKILVRNNFTVGTNVELFGPGFKTFETRIEKIIDEDGKEIEVANKPMSVVEIQLEKQVGDKAMGRRL